MLNKNLKVLLFSSLVFFTTTQAYAQNIDTEHIRSYIPEDKQITNNYISSLYERGQSQIFNNRDNKYVAMPCGGIATGQVDIQASGKLCFYEDIFNSPRKQNRGFGNSTGYQYLNPVVNKSQVENEFAIAIINSDGSKKVYPLNNDGFDNITFVGEYPIARLTYNNSDNSLPVEIASEVFSSFEPQNVKASSNPMVFMRYTIKNISNKRITASLAGWLKGTTLLENETDVLYQNVVNSDKNISSLSLKMVPKVGDDIFSEEVLNHLNFGELNLAILNGKSTVVVDSKDIESLFDCKTNATLSNKNNTPLAGGVYQDITLSPGEEKSVTFVVSWFYPNFKHVNKAYVISDGIQGRYYDNWYDSAYDVAKYAADNYNNIYNQTTLFHDTYYDTTIPHWLADKMTRSLSILSAGNIFLWKNGRFYAYEGINFCPGTCGHVYNFVATIAQLFPSMERSVRLMQDYDENFGYRESGRINFRGHLKMNEKHDHSWASDAQSGYVLKTYREHLMSTDNSFLDSVWEKVKMVIGYQIFKDGAEIGLRPNGVLECEQTFWDPMWYGPNPYNNTLYLAALRAAEEMALIKNEPDLAARYRSLFIEGKEYMDSQMWNGEYYAHLYPSGMIGANGVYNGYKLFDEIDQNAKSYITNFNDGKPTYFKSTACDANQLFGQNWANQLGLGDILFSENCKKAMESVYKYNFTPDISTVYSFTKPKHRTLAAAGEAAMVNGSWPKEAPRKFENTHDKTDIWTGLEYDAACNMINLGLIDEAFVVVKAIDNRYDGVKRNPWNEIEGSDHYSRSMHSWNILRSLNGSYYNGPQGVLSFNPKITPENYKAFFTAAEGWGSYSQKLENGSVSYSIEIKHGQLNLNKLTLPTLLDNKEYSFILNDKNIDLSYEVSSNNLIIFASNLKILDGGKLLVISKGNF
ncbi:MAG: GH116 family glycosyl hydrolase [Rikenellaceae bacterium]